MEVEEIVDLVMGVDPVDPLLAQHKDEALGWLGSTRDIFRRAKPATPSPHLVSYFLLIDRSTNRFLLCHHRLSGLWLPTGGHVEPFEDPVGTVRREAREELGIEAEFDRRSGAQPFFLTVTGTVDPEPNKHVDVSLWFALQGSVGMPLQPDAREFWGVRWFTRADLDGLDGATEPHLIRALDALGVD